MCLDEAHRQSKGRGPDLRDLSWRQSSNRDRLDAARVPSPFVPCKTRITNLQAVAAQTCWLQHAVSPPRLFSADLVRLHSFLNRMGGPKMQCDEKEKKGAAADRPLVSQRCPSCSSSRCSFSLRLFLHSHTQRQYYSAQHGHYITCC